MGKFYGKVGFYKGTNETAQSVYEEEYEEISYRGDVIRNFQRWEKGIGLNDDVSISNQISILADPYMSEHVGLIRYVVWLGTKWKVTNIEATYPRIILSLGGVYNGEQA